MLQQNSFPELLTRKQQEVHLEVSRHMLECAKTRFCEKIEKIAWDESWIYRYHLETKAQSSQPKEGMAGVDQGQDHVDIFVFTIRV